MKRLAAFLVSLVVLPLAAWADPPGRVGRLAWVQGEVAVFADADQGWERAGINTHLTSENSVWTEPGARAEVRAGSLALRLEEATQLDIVRLDDDTLIAHVVRGSLAVRVRYFERGENLTITTPDARFHIRGNGRYRIDADPERLESRLTVLSGNARLEAQGGIVQVDTGRSIRVTGGPQVTWEYDSAYLAAIDDWAQARDDSHGEREVPRYVSPRMTGWEDLDEYGVWRNEPEYGTVWYPTQVAVGWAPYRHGRWTWVRPWGWSWVDDAPWGYAPFHYGRWVYIGNRWGWYPGRYVHRPVWAPALVGWVGRPGWSVTVSSGPLNVVGWYPLSPFDRYQPWYAANTTYVNNVNNVVIVNRRPPRDNHNRDRGATVVARENFASHRPVQNSLAPVPGEVIRAQPVTLGSTVLPSRQEWQGRGKPVTSAPSATAPAPGGGFPAPRASSPVAPAPGMPVGKPMAVQPATPAFPAAPSAPTARGRPGVPAAEAPRVIEKPTKPVAGQPAGRSAEKPVASPPAGRSAEKPVYGQPTGRSAEKPVYGQPTGRSAEKPVSGQPAGRSTEKPVSGQPAGRSTEKPVSGQPAGRSAEKPVSGQPAGRSTEKPAAAQPAGRSAEKPVPKPAEKPGRVE